METFLTFLLAGAVAFWFLRSYLQKMNVPQTGQSASHPTTKPLHPCPRCGMAMEKGSAFCQHCGAAIAMWTVHQAAHHTAGTLNAPPPGKPQPVINASLCIGCASCVHACPETGTLAMEQGKAILAHPERCVGHARCAEVCPTQALTLAIGGVLRTLRVPLVKENFETNVEGVFIVGELSGMGLIKTAINEGKLVVDHLRQRLNGAVGDEHMYDIAIVGAGPAGLSASLTAQQYGLRYVTLEQGEIASTIRQYPRQKFLMAEPIEIPLYGSLYVGDGSKESLLGIWETIIANTGVQIRTNERVESVQRSSTGFRVVTARGEHRARFVVLALGKRGTPRRLGVPGEDLGKVSYSLIEAESYSNKDVLVVGGGDSAIEAAVALARSGTNCVTLSYRGESIQRARARNLELLQAAGREGRATILLRSKVDSILSDRVSVEVEGNQRLLSNDFVFVLIGGEQPEEFLTKIGIEVVEKSITRR